VLLLAEETIVVFSDNDIGKLHVNSHGISLRCDFSLIEILTGRARRPNEKIKPHVLP